VIRMPFVLCASLIAAPVWAGDPVHPTDFAYGAGIVTEGDGALYRLQLPGEVYAGALREDLGDLRVFNAAGISVPHSLASGGPEKATTSISHKLPLFPLYADVPQDALSIRLRVERGRDGQTLRIDHRPERADGLLSGYVLDAGAVPTRVNRFTASWGAADFLIRVDLEASDDLEHWRTLATGATLADLRHLGHHLKRDSIPVDPVKARYYRIGFADPSKAVPLTGVSAQGAHHPPIAHYREMKLALQRGPEAGEYRFVIPPAVRMQRLRVSLPEVNTLVEARFESRPGEREPWRERGRLTLYRLRQNGAELTQDDVTLARTRDRQWRLLVDRGGGGLGEGLPKLTLLWRNHELRFVARGEGPYSLAWGSAKALPAYNSRLSAAGITPLEAWISGPMRRVGDDSVLRSPVHWRHWLLWSVLVLGALLLVGMAARLFRQMNNAD
jgi:hypothetical protein